MSVVKTLFKYFLVFSLASASLLCISILAQAAIYYVAEYGNDSNLGTEEKPWRTIDKAADTMVAGDTVYVKQGDYSGFMVNRSGTTDNYISYLAYSGHTPIIGQIFLGKGQANVDRLMIKYRITKD